MNNYFNKSQQALIRRQQRNKLFYTTKRHSCKSNQVGHILKSLQYNCISPAIQRQYIGNAFYLACRYGNLNMVKFFINTSYKKTLTVQHISWALLITYKESRYLGDEEKRIKKSDDCLKIYHLLFEVLSPKILAQAFEYMITDLNRAPTIKQFCQHLSKEKCKSIFRHAVTIRLTNTIVRLVPEISHLLNTDEIIDLCGKFPQHQKTFIISLTESKLLALFAYIQQQNLIDDKDHVDTIHMVINNFSNQQCRSILEQLIELKKTNHIGLLFNYRQSIQPCLQQLPHHRFIELIAILVVNNRLDILQQLCSLQGDAYWIKLLHQGDKVSSVLEIAMRAGYFDLVEFLLCCLLKAVVVIGEKQVTKYLWQIFKFMIDHKNNELMVFLLIKMNQATNGWWQKLMLRVSGEMIGINKNALALMSERMIDKLCIWFAAVRSKSAQQNHSNLLAISRRILKEFCVPANVRSNDFLKGLHQILRLTITKSMCLHTELFKGINNKSELPLAELLCWCVSQSRYDLAQQLIYLGADPFKQISPYYYNAFYFCLSINQIYELLSIYIQKKQGKPENIILGQERARLLQAKLQVVSYFRSIECKTKFLGGLMPIQKPKNREQQLLRTIIQTALKAISMQNLHELLHNAKFKYNEKCSLGKHDAPIIQQLDLALKAIRKQVLLPENVL